MRSLNKSGGWPASLTSFVWPGFTRRQPYEACSARRRSTEAWREPTPASEVRGLVKLRWKLDRCCAAQQACLSCDSGAKRAHPRWTSDLKARSTIRADQRHNPRSHALFRNGLDASCATCMRNSARPSHWPSGGPPEPARAQGSDPASGAV